MIILPAIDIQNGECVRLYQGDFSTAHKVSDSPQETAAQFRKAGAEWVHMVDLDGAKEARAKNTALFLEIAKHSGLKVELGGGIRTLETVETYLESGISRVILGSAAVKNPELVEQAKAIAAENHCTVTLTEDVNVGTKNANVIYTDIWVSMGEPDEVWETRIKLLKPYQVNAAAMQNAAPDAIFMHCLPSFHDTKTTIGAQIAEKFGIPEMEVTDEVFESPQSVVFDEAENRMHTIKAVIYATLC